MHMYVHKYPRIAFIYSFVLLVCLQYEVWIKTNETEWCDMKEIKWEWDIHFGMVGKKLYILNYTNIYLFIYLFFLINRAIVCIDGSSQCDSLRWVVVILFISIGCFKPYYCFRHDKLIPSQRRRFSIFVFLLKFFYYYYYYYLN